MENSLSVDKNETEEDQAVCAALRVLAAWAQAHRVLSMRDAEASAARKVYRDLVLGEHPRPGWSPAKEIEALALYDVAKCELAQAEVAEEDVRAELARVAARYEKARSWVELPAPDPSRPIHMRGFKRAAPTKAAQFAVTEMTDPKKDES